MRVGRGPVPVSFSRVALVGGRNGVDVLERRGVVVALHVEAVLMLGLAGQAEH